MSIVYLSHPSKFLAFLSLQIHHIKQRRKAFQISLLQCHPKWPCQLTSKSTTFLGIPQKEQRPYPITSWQ